MGSNGSKSKKSFSPVKSFGQEAKHNCSVNLNVPSEKKPNNYLQRKSSAVKIPSNISPFIVLYRQGSMYFDEDGDLAHEFYVEVKDGRKRKMKRVRENLTPQGIIRLPYPRLHQDCPVVLYMFEIFLNTTDNSRELGGASRVSGGRDDSHPLSTKRPWIPPSSIRRDAALSQENTQDVVFRKVRGILNKLTPENFQKLSDDLLNCKLNSVVILRGVILLIFEKALDEPKYSSMYAQLCKRLSEEAPNFANPPNPCTFRILLLNKCRTEFENRSKASAEFETATSLSPDDEERKLLAKRKMLGNIKFIGELGKLEILAENILHQCIQQLLPRKSHIKDMAEDVECLCQIMRTCGRILDHEQGQSLMQQYFDRMLMFVNDPGLPQRIRFMIQDVIDLRRDRWMPRKAIIGDGPLPIHELVEEDFVRPSNNSVPSGNHNRNVNNGILQSTTDMFRRSLKVRDDIIGPSFSNFTNGFGSGSFRSNNRMNSLHGSGQMPPTNQMNHAPRMVHFQNNTGHSNTSAQNGNSHYTDGGNNSFTHNTNNECVNSGSGGGSEHATSNTVPNDVPSLNMGGKDIVPRYKRMLQQGTNLDDVSLRPSANSMVCKPPNLKQSSNQNNSKNNSVMRIPMPPTKAVQITQEVPPIIFKSATNEKTKNNRKDKGQSKDEIIKKTTLVIDNLSNSGDLEAALAEFIDIKVPDRFLTDVLVNALTHVFNNKNAKKDHELISQFIVLLQNKSLISNSHVVDCFRNLMTKMPWKMSSDPPIYSHIAAFAAHVICEGMLSLSEVADATQSGKHFPLMLITLQNINKNLGEAQLIELFNKSSINLLHTLPEADRTKERLAELLEYRKLTFLFPLLRIESDLWKQLKSDGDPNNLQQWIKENLSEDHANDPGFISALATVIIKYVTSESTLPENAGASVCPDKAVSEKEKVLLLKFVKLLRHFVGSHPDLQLVVLYAVQVYCYSINFPKGMLIRWFDNLYDLDIIEEDVFDRWREDINDAYPGKGEALFQVSSWLRWLAACDSEEDDEEEEEEEKLSDNGA